MRVEGETFPSDAHEDAFRRALDKSENVAKITDYGIAVRPKYIGSFADTSHRNTLTYFLAERGLSGDWTTQRIVETLQRKPHVWIEFHYGEDRYS